jgi:hypothetical protein
VGCSREIAGRGLYIAFLCWSCKEFVALVWPRKLECYTSIDIQLLEQIVLSIFCVVLRFSSFVGCI